MKRLGLFRFIPILFPLFGLAACTPDKHSRQDDWGLTPPLVRAEPSSDKNVATPNDYFLAAALDKPIPATSRLVFPSLEHPDFAADPVDFTVHTQCMSSITPNTPMTAAVPAATAATNPTVGIAAEQDFKFANVAEIPIAALLPEKLLLDRESATAPLKCTWNFSAKNRFGSEHTFQFQNVLVADLQKGFAAGLSFTAAAIDGVITEQDFSRVTLPMEPSSGDIVRLACENFATEQHPDIGEFDFTKLAYKGLSREGSDPRSQVRFQKCVLIYLPGGNRDHLQISQTFSLHFALPEVKSWVLQAWTGGFNQPGLFTFKVENTHAFPILVGISVGKQMAFHSLHYAGPDQGGLSAFLSPTFVSLADNPITKGRWIGEDFWLEVQPHTTASLLFGMDRTVQCNPLLNNTEYEFLGLWYFFQREVKALRTARYSSFEELDKAGGILQVDESSSLQKLVPGYVTNYQGFLRANGSSRSVEFDLSLPRDQPTDHFCQ